MTRQHDEKSRSGSRVKRRNPVAKALIERALGVRVVPDRKRYTRKIKHRRRTTPEPE